ncbi:hypothetical protein LINGRAPRIM_LOCUS1286 [Linum grandiflorum]
MPGVPRA